VFLGCENEVVVLVAQRLEGGPVNSKVNAFPEVLSVANRGPEGSLCRGELGVGFSLTPGEFDDEGSGACLSSRVERERVLLQILKDSELKKLPQCLVLESQLVKCK